VRRRWRESWRLEIKRSPSWNMPIGRRFGTASWPQRWPAALWSPGRLGNLIKLWSDDFDVYEESGEYKVVSRDGRPVSQLGRERLGGPEFAHFCLPSSRGGSGARGLSQSGAAARVTPATLTLGEAIISQWRESPAASVIPTPGPAGGADEGDPPRGRASIILPFMIFSIDGLSFPFERSSRRRLTLHSSGVVLMANAYLQGIQTSFENQAQVRK